jgi:hypothetical protein
MLTAKIEAIACRQVRPCRKEVTLRLHLLNDDQEVLTTDCTEPLGDAPPGQAGDLVSLRDRFAKRMQGAVDQYKSDRDFSKTPAIAQLVTDIEAALKP